MPQCTDTTTTSAMASAALIWDFMVSVSEVRMIFTSVFFGMGIPFVCSVNATNTIFTPLTSRNPIFSISS